MARSTQSGLKSWEHPKKSGIRIREIVNATKGGVFGCSYQVIVPARITGSLRERKQFVERTEAEEHAEKAIQGFKKQGHDFFALTDTERREVASAMPLLRKHGIALGDAVRFAVTRMRPGTAGKKVSEVIAELLASKEQRCARGDLRELSLKDFRYRTNRLAEGFGDRPISEINGAQVKVWLVGLKLEPRNTFNLFRIVSEVFRFAHQRRYVAENPLDELAQIDRKEIIGHAGEAKEPAILRDLISSGRVKSARVGAKIVVRREWLDAFLGA